MGTSVHLQCRNKVDKNIDSSLNVEELRHAEETCLRFSQQESNAQELKNLKQDKPIPRESQIFKLSHILSKKFLNERNMEIKLVQMSGIHYF